MYAPFTHFKYSLAIETGDFTLPFKSLEDVDDMEIDQEVESEDV